MYGERRPPHFHFEEIDGLGWIWVLKDANGYEKAVSPRFYLKRGACEGAAFELGPIAMRAADNTE